MRQKTEKIVKIEVEVVTCDQCGVSVERDQYQPPARMYTCYICKKEICRTCVKMYFEWSGSDYPEFYSCKDCEHNMKEADRYAKSMLEESMTYPELVKSYVGQMKWRK